MLTTEWRKLTSANRKWFLLVLFFFHFLFFYFFYNPLGGVAELLYGVACAAEREFDSGPGHGGGISMGTNSNDGRVLRCRCFLKKTRCS